MELGIGGLGQASEIGAGASAVVYKALQIDLDRQVAVKVLSATDEAFVRRFRREAKTLGKLSLNPGIVTVHGTGVTESGHPYLILELCESSVLDHLKASGPFSPDAACRAGVQVADAVSDAHSNGVIHRDIKPGNILLSQTGNYLITDFGISTVSGATIGQTDSIGFTAGYVAPETLRGEEAGTPADVYALGATLFHMVSGQAPFVDQDRTSNLLALAQRVINDPVPDLRPSGIPEDVCRIIEGAMAKHPMDRPTAAQLRDQLQAVIRDDPAGSPLGAPVSSPTVSSASSPAIVPTTPLFPQNPQQPPEHQPFDTSPSRAEDSADTGVYTDAVAYPDPGAHSDAGSTVIGAPPEDFSPNRSVLADTGRQPSAGPYQRPAPAHLPLPPVTRRPWLPVVLGGLAAFVLGLGIVAAVISLQSDGGSNVEATDETPNAPSTSALSGNDEDGDGNSGDQSDDGNVGTLPGETTPTTDGLPQLVPVQDVVGQAVGAARTRLRQLGLEVVVVEREDPDATPGTVIEQRPAADTEAPVGSTITLFVATDQELETVKVPAVAGLTAAEAAELITDAGLTRETTSVFDAAVAEGNIVSVTPAGGTTVEVGSAVSLVISRGPLPTECPDVAGLTETAAKTLLEGDGFAVTVQRVESATVPAGQVIECTVATSAVLSVSTGPDICTTAIGSDLAEGTAALEAKDLTVTATAVPNGSVPAQQILTCEVQGTAAAVGYAVSLPTTCPAEVDGATAATARTALLEAGFTEVTAQPTPSETVPQGTVISCTVTGATAKLVVSSGPAAAPTGDLTITFKAITVTEACAGDGLRPEIYGSLGFSYDGDAKAVWANRPRGEARTPNAEGEIAFNVERTWTGVPTGEALTIVWDLRDEDNEGRAGDEDGEDDPVSAGNRDLELTGEDRTWRPVSGTADPCALEFTVDISWSNLSS